MINKYLIKIGNQLRIIPSKKMDTFSVNDAIAVGIESLAEQKQQLLKDALEGTEKHFYGRKVVESLELSISKLEEIFPNIRQQIKHLTNGNVSVN